MLLHFEFIACRSIPSFWALCWISVVACIDSMVLTVVLSGACRSFTMRRFSDDYSQWFRRLFTIVVLFDDTRVFAGRMYDNGVVWGNGSKVWVRDRWAFRRLSWNPSCCGEIVIWVMCIYMVDTSHSSWLLIQRLSVTHTHIHTHTHTHTHITTLPHFLQLLSCARTCTTHAHALDTRVASPPPTTARDFVYSNACTLIRNSVLQAITPSRQPR